MISELNGMFERQENRRWTFQLVLTKVDSVSTGALQDQVTKTVEAVWNVAPSCQPPYILTSSSNWERRGIDEMRESIVEACGVLRTRRL